MDNNIKNDKESEELIKIYFPNDEDDNSENSSYDQKEKYSADKLSTKQLTTSLYLHIFKTAETIGSQEEIFDQMPQGKNFEPLFLYSSALFEVHNHTHGNHLDDDIFDDCMIEYYQYLIEKGVYSPDEAKKRLYEANLEMVSFATDHVSFLTGGEEYGLMQYVPAVLSKFPTARATRVFSYEGTAFAAILPELIEKVSSVYTKLISSWDKSLDSPQQPPSEPLDDDIKGIPPKSEENIPPSESAKKKPWFTICAVALICSIIGNIWLFTENTNLIIERQEVASDLSDALSDVNYWKVNYDKAKQRSDYYSEKYLSIEDEYYFYHNYAVIVTDSGYRYHTYGCSHLNFDSFWIYNINAAKSQGYTPCLDCEPPQ